jgi:pimeloyl-ACP methyl ester carboxylesterase
MTIVLSLGGRGSRIPRGGDARGVVTAALAGWLVALVLASVCEAQPGPPPVAPLVPGVQKPVAGPAAPAKAKAGDKEADEPPPAPEVVLLDTKDGWRIHCLYYAPKEGLRKGKEVVPVILLHGWDGNGGEYNQFATYLQTLGHAAAVPDLRGHGRSDKRRDDRGDLQTVKYDDPSKFKTRVELNGIVQDVEVVKRMLVEKNNAAEVNIEMLCVVGADFGCTLGLNWAALDWSYRATPSYKQGQDVKALVLLSPPKKNPLGYDCNLALATPFLSTDLSSIMISAGENNREALGEAKRIHSRLDQKRAKLKPDDDPAKRQTLWLIPATTDMQGTKLLDRNLPIYRFIAKFITLRLINKQEELVWSERRNPLSK